jgi:hypothetical protein
MRLFLLFLWRETSVVPGQEADAEIVLQRAREVSSSKATGYQRPGFTVVARVTSRSSSGSGNQKHAVANGGLPGYSGIGENELSGNH